MTVISSASSRDRSGESGKETAMRGWPLRQACRRRHQLRGGFAEDAGDDQVRRRAVAQFQPVALSGPVRLV